MRIQAAVAVSLIAVLPTVVAAQRAGRIIGEVVKTGTDKTVVGARTPEPIARSMAYTRSRVSIEDYNIASYSTAPTFAGGAISHWTSFVQGMHAEYRSNSFVAGSIDLTQSVVGGPLSEQTVEVGARFRPTNWDHVWSPFFDVRSAYLRSGGAYSVPNSGLGAIGQPFVPVISGQQYSRGFGGETGAGIDYWVGRNWTLTSGVAAIRSEMNEYNVGGASSLPTDAGHFTLTSYRMILGIRYTAGRISYLQ